MVILSDLSDAGPFVAVLFRILAPVFILRWPLGGFAAAIVADTLDVVIVAVLQSGTFTDYTSTDKLLDTYALGFAALVAVRWENTTARYTSIVLFLYRLTGVLVVALTGSRWLLFVFPNIFEMFYVYHLSTVKWFPDFQVDRHRKLIVVLSLLTLMKLVQEYVLHVGGIHSSCYICAAALATICCLPTSVTSLTYLLFNFRQASSGDATKAVQSARQSRMWGLATLAIGAWFVIFWVGLTALDFAVGP